MSILSKSTKTIKLNSGYSIPVIGLGTWQATEKGAAANAVKVALQNGYRHIDTAAIYGNEEEVGQGIKESGIPRSEIFVTTKLWNKDQRTAEDALTTSLKKLGLDYVDLYLIHWPIPLKQDGSVDTEWDVNSTYKSLQKLVAAGKTKSIGVSNFNKQQLERLLADPEVTITPAVNQIEGHPLLPQPELFDYLTKNGIHAEYYSPLGSTGAPLFKYELVTSLAKKYNAEPAQILISWAVQKGAIVLPKSVTSSRVIDNLSTLTLSDEDFKALSTLVDNEGVVRNVNPNWGGPVFP
ncbi:putative reductase 1 [[Candida] railenensis]|uniref:2-dehydropantolactone reductase n=1 Tax=[Candida] railenensis TaxID=45579 RepID=A0A9P0QSR5_9ASCO|nr:putative reductase 1 [[Candida] railenensis]